jgi:hypothetical protein
MSNRVNISKNLASTNRIPFQTDPNIGIVVDVILDETHKRLVESDDDTLFSTGINTIEVGYCVIRPLNDQVSAENNLVTYAPYDSLNLDLPLIGETVQLIKLGNISYYKRITRSGLNLGNAKVNYNKDIFNRTEPKQNSAADYNKTSQTGITNTSGTNDRDTGLDDREVFEEQQTNRLKFYEGDKLIQSRFGQSIRFSGYNNPEGEYAPTILIRNRQNDISVNDLKPGDVTEEDINRDGSTILITSGEYKIPFQPGTVDDGGSSDFKTRPDHFEEYPSELKGLDQMLINTGRILISSKSGEMIFYSKGNWGFISDGIMSIDNGKGGANLDFNGDVRLTTNDSNTYILGGKGSIFLNTESDAEPLARAQTLVDILGEILDAIVKQIYSTPSGPTALGPNNASDFNKIKSKLDKIKSTLNFTE